MTKRVVEGIGWCGVLAILTAYLLLNLRLVGVDSLWYQLLNVTGAAAIILDAVKAKNYQPAVLNVIWLLIAFVAFIRILLA